MANADLEDLKLLAFDGDDLAVISAHLQDAVVRVEDLAYLAENGQFAIVARRFDWQSPGKEPRRRLAGLHFDRVLRCRTRGIDRTRPDASLSLLAITFEMSDAPSGTARLTFAGGASIELEVECLEARLKDLGPVWSAGARPGHDLEST